MSDYYMKVDLKVTTNDVKNQMSDGSYQILTFVCKNTSNICQKGLFGSFYFHLFKDCSVEHFVVPSTLHILRFSFLYILMNV